jgi:hypothetical protein
MPGGDRTGPLGMGPLTGRGAGYCRGYDMAGYANRWASGWGAGRGGGFGRGGYGRGWRNRYLATGVPGWAWNRGAGAATPYFESPAGQPRRQEQRYLEEQAEFLRRELEAIDRRLSELKTTNKET